MKKVLIYAGTTEGRQLAEQLSQAGIPCDLWVATEYGKLVMPELSGVTVHVGRLDAEEMRAYVTGKCAETGRNDVSPAADEGFLAVVDATHPYAVLVSENIRKSLTGLDIPYFRLLRCGEEVSDIGKIQYFDNFESCASELIHTRGNILLTTGSKELPVFCQNEEVRSRLFVRILPAEENISVCRQNGICGKQILAMQGPFSTELNLALIHQFSISCLVTKEGGEHSGYADKLTAAKDAGITCFVIGNRIREEGMTLPEVFAAVTELVDERIDKPRAKASPAKIQISLVGIGMSGATLTGEAVHALQEADMVFGAERMLEVVPEGKKTYPFYQAKDILPLLDHIQRQKNGNNYKITILFSGDTGFYSGADKIKSELKKCNYEDIKIISGISSISYLSSAAGIPWQEAKILSMHGKSGDPELKAQLLDALFHQRETFLLVSGASDLQKIGTWLEEAGLTEIRIISGFQLSYDDEEIRMISYKEAKNTKKQGLYTLLFLNENPVPRGIVPGIADENFVRSEGSPRVPMTKEEVRALSLCKLALTENAVVYDVGSGTGSIAIECALRSPGVLVYAIEQKPEAVRLLRKNMEKFHVANIIPVEGTAPEVLKGLEPPTHVFIGGSGGRLWSILSGVWDKNPDARVVVTAVSLETIAEISHLEADFTPPEGRKLQCETVQLQVSRANQLGAYHMMKAENPVYICTMYLQKIYTK